jgi:hypothetical protein
VGAIWEAASSQRLRPYSSEECVEEELCELLLEVVPTAVCDDIDPCKQWIHERSHSPSEQGFAPVMRYMSQPHCKPL